MGKVDREERHFHWLDREDRVVQEFHPMDKVEQGPRQVDKELLQVDKEEHWQLMDLEGIPYPDP